MKKIILISPWFGKFRNDFPFWLQSAELNSTIDFLIFTDQEILDAPSNVFVHKTTLKYVEQLAQEKIHRGCVIAKPYKLCDYKPAYGEIFQDYIKDYDYWGHCDNDLIFGNIRHFFPDDLLDKFDRLLTRGHLTLYRNTCEVNSHYRKLKCPNYKEVFSNPKGYGFDEWPGTSRYWMDNMPEKLYDEIIFDDIAPFVYSFYSYQNREIDKDKKNFMFSFEKGKLYRIYEQEGHLAKEETCYIHYQRRKLAIYTKPSNSFTIVPNRIIDFVCDVSLDYLRKNIRTGMYWVYKERLLNKINKIFGYKSKRTYLTLHSIDS